MSATNPQHTEEEYVDYSCSTGVERLTRDVESLLRSWHIHDGCDRHFSPSSSSNSHPGLTLLRAERFTWIAALPQRQSLRIELELALWDGPAKSNTSAPSSTRSCPDAMPSTSKSKKAQHFAMLARKSKKAQNRTKNNRRSSFDNIYQSEEETELHNHLPKSLQRSQHPSDLIDMPDRLFDNFSTMFGIDQHITLAPTNPAMDLGMDDQASSTVTNLCHALLGRHKPAQARWVLTQLLASWLQTALNCAAMNCQSCLPVFGVWGNYPSASLPSSEDEESHNIIASSYGNDQKKSQKQSSLPIFPPWLDAARDLKGPIQKTVSAQKKSPKKKRKGKSKLNVQTTDLPNLSANEPWIKNALHAPPIVTGSVLPTTETRANFTCTVLSSSTLLEEPLSTWGNLLVQQCSEPGDDNVLVVLSGARHVYAWSKSKSPSSESKAWRGVDPKEYWKQQQQQQQQQQQPIRWGKSEALAPTPSSSNAEVEDYRCECRSHALHLLEQATRAACWGPQQDPIDAVQATICWKSKVIQSSDHEPTTVEALGHFPSPTTFDASSLLDPKRASSFQVQTFLDHQALEPTLATTQRCTLACLIRTSTLAPLTLMRHLLWEEDIVEDWDHEAGNRAALKVARKACVGEATRTLVDVMDWKTCAEETISEKEANEIVHEVMEGTSSFGFPSPPEGMFDQQRGFQKRHPLLDPLYQSAPVGRLVSSLCARLAQLRTPCSMALVWSTFCRELRQRWDEREPLPNMQYVAGLDPSPTALAECRKLTTIGVKADLAAFLNCSEPDPDDHHCLIGQKLQVFNIGIETMTMIEESQAQQQTCEDNLEEREESAWRHELESEQRNGSPSPPPARLNSMVSLSSEVQPTEKEVPLESTTSSFGRLQIPSELFKGKRRNESIIDGLGLLSTESAVQVDEDEVSMFTGAESEFFDAEECGMSVFTSRSIFTRNIAAATTGNRIERKGARCPLRGCSLVASGDQVYAPYLRRPEPLTDDIVLERRFMLSEEFYASETNTGGGTALQNRLEIAYRLQRPKLLSDMNAFKAANPGAIFQDFVSWYGNPGNPLEDYCSRSMAEKSHLASSHIGLASADSIAMKLDKATEAIHILNETRTFWSCTWNEAVAVPASEQKPLYEVFSTVEMTLDYLENMHPAILLNQVMAIQLANSYFVLVVSAKDAVKVPAVASPLEALRHKTEEALHLLAEEASNATRSFFNMQSDSKSTGASFVSVDAIKRCEEVCSCFCEAEIMVAVATSLLQKFPGQYGTVQSVLDQADGDKIELQDPIGQTQILEAIGRQQAQLRTDAGMTPKPVLREYQLRNVDDSKPCQLSIRYGDTSLSQDDGETNNAGLLLALTKSRKD